MNPGIPDHHQLLQSRHPGPDQGVESTVQALRLPPGPPPRPGWRTGAAGLRGIPRRAVGAEPFLARRATSVPAASCKIFQFRLRDFFCRLCQVCFGSFLGFPVFWVSCSVFSVSLDGTSRDPEGTNPPDRRGRSLPKTAYSPSRSRAQTDRKCQQHRQRDPKSQQRAITPRTALTERIPQGASSSMRRRLRRVGSGDLCRVRRVHDLSVLADPHLSLACHRSGSSGQLIQAGSDGRSAETVLVVAVQAGPSGHLQAAALLDQAPGPAAGRRYRSCPRPGSDPHRPGWRAGSRR